MNFTTPALGSGLPLLGAIGLPSLRSWLLPSWVSPSTHCCFSYQATHERTRISRDRWCSAIGLSHCTLSALSTKTCTKPVIRVSTMLKFTNKDATGVHGWSHREIGIA
jgi:hypothetical protein